MVAGDAAAVGGAFEKKLFEKICAYYDVQSCRY